ncbi:hypothetical protein MTP04_24750 [Lysinibacillus sp. PLM2]|nr:hypothetical protein MTP04_24750 [Lysinibacillus sp. PLM2]
MKPTLTVEGKKLEIVAVGVKAEQSDNTQYFYDKEASYYMDDNQKIDFTKAIENTAKQIETLETLNAHLEESEQYLQELKMKIADEVILNSDVPFITEAITNLVKEHHNHNIYIEGLAASIELIKRLECEVPSTE